ncbi:MaoC family dehydratase [Paraburkholderia oxyphila]|uniref:MaoC family dehydratase n=1 Tax=Paraburkholderia oxyphila TaxID=614212 RepID=UPI000482885F|nr:MaoC family dehydratase [Paraburkholderia oxyphila]
MSGPDTRRFDDVSVGDVLPPLEIPVTTTGIVAAAIATRDYQNVHHDPEAARRLGSPDIFMNILTSNALVERYVGEWAGPEALLRSVSIRLGVPNYPGMTMAMNGQVSARAVDGERWVDIDVVGRNERGDHLTGTVRIELAGGAAHAGR